MATIGFLSFLGCLRGELFPTSLISLVQRTTAIPLLLQLATLAGLQNSTTVGVQHPGVTRNFVTQP